MQDKISFSGVIPSVQPRSNVWRYRLDNRTHSMTGYNIFLRGTAEGIECDFAVAVSEKQQQKMRFHIGDGYAGGKYEHDLFEGLWEFPSDQAAWEAAREGMSSLERNVLMHGDYCLPNIMLDDWKLSGFIDLINGGVGDRHIDVLWGIWTLKYNLGTGQYTDRFIDAYGQDAINKEKLRCIAAMEIFGG